MARFALRKLQRRKSTVPDSTRTKMIAMAARDVDDYLDGLAEPKRSTLRALRQTILRILPSAMEGISYGMPAFRIEGKVVAGFAAFDKHLSYLPHSGSVLSQLSEDLAGYQKTSGSLHFGIDRPLPEPLVEKLIAVRLGEIQQRAPEKRRGPGGPAG